MLTLARYATRILGCEIGGYWMALLTCEKTLLAFDPIRRTVPTTITRTTASMTEYSAIS